VSSFKISSFLRSNKLYPAVHFMTFTSVVFSPLTVLCFNVQISQPYKSDGIAKILHTFNEDCLWAKFGFKTLSLPLHTKFYIPNVSMYLLVPV
jgi:hypothetical protein